MGKKGALFAIHIINLSFSIKLLKMIMTDLYIDN
jgi:hypothetical protein